jgi:hypothetical protein
MTVAHLQIDAISAGAEIEPISQHNLSPGVFRDRKCA